MAIEVKRMPSYICLLSDAIGKSKTAIAKHKTKTKIAPMWFFLLIITLIILVPFTIYELIVGNAMLLGRW